MSQYNEVIPELTEQFRQITLNHVFVNGDINDDFTHNEMPIYGRACLKVIIEATSTEEVAAVVKLYYENSIPVTFKGADTGLTGDVVALCGGAVLSITKMSGVLGYDRESLNVHVQSGALLSDLAEDATKRGPPYPPDPNEKFVTLGGNVANNADGMRAMKHSATRDYVCTIAVALPTGEIVRLGAGVSESSSGYNLLHLMIGSEGMLSIVTELTLKLIPQSKEVVSLTVPPENPKECIAAVPRIMLTHPWPQALEFMEHEIVISFEAYPGRSVSPQESEGGQVSAYLLITFDGENASQLDGIVKEAPEVALEVGALDVPVIDIPALKKDAWAIRSSFLEVIEAQTKLLDRCDVIVLTSRVVEYLTYIKSIEADCGSEIKNFGHAGDGNLHIYTCSNDMELKEFKSQVHDSMKKAYARAMEFDGFISGEYGISHDKQIYLSEMAGSMNMHLMKEIKSVFDPKVILNPGKVCLKLQETASMKSKKTDFLPALGEGGNKNLNSILWQKSQIKDRIILSGGENNGIHYF